MQRTLFENLKPMIETVFLFWFFFFGAAIGSFLNVVVYRLPLGKSLSYPPSHCPICSHPIRWYDNVPVVGWLHLGGKCRDCKSPISVRYPLIEGVCGVATALFTFLLFQYRIVPPDILATNLVTPTGLDEPLPPIESVFSLLTIYTVLFYTLLTAGLIEYDGHRVPVTLFVPLIIMVLGTPFLCGAVTILPVKEMLLGSTFAVIFSAVYIVPRKTQIGWILSLALIGAVLGPFPAIIVALATNAILVPVLFLAKKNNLSYLILTGTTFALIVALFFVSS